MEIYGIHGAPGCLCHTFSDSNMLISVCPDVTAVGWLVDHRGSAVEASCLDHSGHWGRWGARRFAAVLAT